MRSSIFDDLDLDTTTVKVGSISLVPTYSTSKRESIYSTPPLSVLSSRLFFLKYANLKIRMPFIKLGESYNMFDITYLQGYNSEFSRNIPAPILLKSYKLSLRLTFFLELSPMYEKVKEHNLDWYKKTINLDCFLFPDAKHMFTKEQTIKQINKRYLGLAREIKRHFNDIYTINTRNGLNKLKGSMSKFYESLVPKISKNSSPKQLKQVQSDGEFIKYLMTFYFDPKNKTKPCEFTELQNEQLQGYFLEITQYIGILYHVEFLNAPGLDFSVNLMFNALQEKYTINLSYIQYMQATFDEKQFKNVINLLNDVNLAIIEGVLRLLPPMPPLPPMFPLPPIMPIEKPKDE